LRMASLEQVRAIFDAQEIGLILNLKALACCKNVLLY
jgi:hypothetical protein